MKLTFLQQIQLRQIRISPFFAKWILMFNPFRKVLVMCKGYDDDYENFTELVRRDDLILDFYNEYEYPEFQLWIL